jgi:P-type Ca2+ transporter type 2C
VRHDTRSVFSRETLNNHTAFIATAAVIVLLVAVVERGALHQVSPPLTSPPVNG